MKNLLFRGTSPCLFALKIATKTPGHKVTQKGQRLSIINLDVYIYVDIFKFF